jgi:hypothetical protein
LRDKIASLKLQLEDVDRSRDEFGDLAYLRKRESIAIRCCHLHGQPHLELRKWQFHRQVSSRISSVRASCDVGEGAAMLCDWRLRIADQAPDAVSQELLRYFEWEAGEY